jgi:hypothetical protein
MPITTCPNCGQEVAPTEQDGQSDIVVGMSVPVGRHNSSSEMIGESISQISLGSHHVESSHHMEPIREDEAGFPSVGLNLSGGDLFHPADNIHGEISSLESNSPTRGLFPSADVVDGESTSLASHCTPTHHFWHLKNKRNKGKEYTKLHENNSYGSFESILRHFHHYDEPSVRSEKRRRLNVILCFFLTLTTLLLVIVAVTFIYLRIFIPVQKKKTLESAVKAHAAAAALRAEQCRGVTWQTACDRIAGAGSRRRLREQHYEVTDDDVDDEDEMDDDVPALEDQFLESDDPTVTYDSNCLKAYRLQMYGNITFPYYSSQLLYAGGNHTMALFIQHGALRDAPDYFCSFKELMLQQHYRPFSEILIIAPDFSYEHDPLVHPNDAFWNSSKPWGDWRVGAESDPKCCGDSGKTVSSFDVLDHMLAMLTSKKLYPKMNKVSFVGHSAGRKGVLFVDALFSRTKRNDTCLVTPADFAPQCTQLLLVQ